MHAPLRSLACIVRCAAIAGAATLLCRAQTASVAPPAAPASFPVRQCHVWQVTYDDRELGLVDGTAIVDWEGRDAQVTLYSPIDDAPSILRVVRMSPFGADGQTEMVLAGPSPNMAPVAAPATDGYPVLGAAVGSQVVARHHGPQASASVAQRAFADDTVTVTLGYNGAGGLSGQWHYRADPLTQRARDGGGRVGTFAMQDDDAESFLGVQSGSESWTYLPPAIRYAVVIEDQGSQGHFGATFGYPRPVGPNREFGAGRANGYANRRTLMIVGENLPLLPTTAGHSRALEPIQTDRADLHYGMPALIGPPKPGADADDDIERAWRTITAGMDDATAKAVRALPAATVDVDFTAGVLPGVTEFTWNGAKAVWQLQFGDNTAKVRAVRATSPTTSEETSTAFLPEQIRVQVETALALPVDSINVFVAANGALQKDPIEATRVPGSPNLYQTGPIVFQGEGPPPADASGMVIAARSGDKVTFVAEQQRGLFFGAAQATVSVFNDPSEVSTTWNHELMICAKLAGKEMPTDWAHLSNQQVESITNYFVFATSEHAITTRITLGQHTAMVLLRDKFIELMKRQQANLQATAADDDGVLGFGKIVAQSIRGNPQSLFSTLPAGTLNGAPVTLADAADDPKLEKAFGTDLAGLRTWKVAAFRQGLLAYVASIQKSIDMAAAVPTDRPKELLKLTGSHFEAVAAQLVPELVHFDKTLGRWVPDQVARANVLSVPGLQQQINDQKGAANIDTQLLVGVLSAAASAPVMFSESAFASALTWAANGLMWEIPAFSEGWELHLLKGDVEFALGASAVLGHARYDEVKALDTDWWKFAVSQLGQGALANLQAIDALSKFGREMAVFRGARILEGLDGGVVALKKLSKAQLADVEAVAIEAKALSAANKELDDVRKNALATWNSYIEESKAGEALASQEWLRASRLRQSLSPRRQDPLLALSSGNAGDASSLAYQIAGKSRATELKKAVADLRMQAFKLKSGEGDVLTEFRSAVSDKILEAKGREDAIATMLAKGREDISTLAKVSDAEVAWITGVQGEVDAARMQGLLARNNSSWSQMKDAFTKTSAVSAADMNQFVRWRNEVVDPMLNGVIKEVEGEMSTLLGRPVTLRRKALGSVNLTSDYDISVEGFGAERVVAKFNERFRKQFGFESAFVFDTNIYTDPAYKLFKARGLSAGGELVLGSVELDTVRQFVYDQMATCKYAPDDVWKAHKALLLAKSAPESRAMIDFAFKQAEAADSEARAILKGYLGAAEGKNAEYQALNMAYADVLGQIDQWRLEMVRLDGLFVPGSKYKALPPPKFLEKFPKYKTKVEKITELIANNDIKNANELRNAMEEQVMAQIRDTQGIALYFASEAYQSEGTILHVVDELQGGGGIKRSAKLEDLLMKPVATSLDPLSYINSFNENRANLFKELGHLGYFPGHSEKEAGKVLAAKSAKYFIRQLDAMKQAGVDLRQVLPGELIELTCNIDAVRGNVDTVEKVLKAANLTGDQYIAKILESSDALAVAGVNNKQFAGLANYLKDDFGDLNRLQGLSSLK